MSANLLRDLGYEDTVGVGAVQGEVVSFCASGRIVIDGNFTPGDGLQLRPGVRVVVLTEDALDEAHAVPANLLAEIKAELRSNISDARSALDDIEGAIDDLKT